VCVRCGPLSKSWKRSTSTVNERVGGGPFDVTLEVA
jgi:hypothetical protein